MIIIIKKRNLFLSQARQFQAGPPISTSIKRKVFPFSLFSFPLSLLTLISFSLSQTFQISCGKERSEERKRKEKKRRRGERKEPLGPFRVGRRSESFDFPFSARPRHLPPLFILLFE